MEYESDGDTDCNRWSQYSHQKIGKTTERLGNKRMSRGHPNYNIIKIDQNTEKSPVDLRKLAVTQIPVRNYQLTLVRKTLKKWKWYHESHERMEIVHQLLIPAGEQFLAEVKIQKEIFPGKSLSQIQLVIAMMPLNYVLINCTGCMSS